MDSNFVLNSDPALSPEAVSLESRRVVVHPFAPQELPCFTATMGASDCRINCPSLPFSGLRRTFDFKIYSDSPMFISNPCVGMLWSAAPPESEYLALNDIQDIAFAHPLLARLPGFAVFRGYLPSQFSYGLPIPSFWLHPVCYHSECRI